MIKSEELYDQFAPYFHLYSRKKQLYLNSVDRLILLNLPTKTDHILDIGAGDGVRGYNLFRKIKAKKITMIDNSSKMIDLLKKYSAKNCKILKCNISSHGEIFKISSKFDIILCLWNVLGHISSNQKRITALKNMRGLLNNNGKIYIDVSNRYNISHYGCKKVVGNIKRDIFSPSIKNGDFDYLIKIKEDITIESSCHFFNPFEMMGLVRKAGLVIDKNFYVNYKTGKKEKMFFQGHLFYILKCQQKQNTDNTANAES